MLYMLSKGNILQYSRLSFSNSKGLSEILRDICLCWGFTAQSTQWGHVERSQFT